MNEWKTWSILSPLLSSSSSSSSFYIMNWIGFLFFVCFHFSVPFRCCCWSAFIIVVTKKKKKKKWNDSHVLKIRSIVDVCMCVDFFPASNIRYILFFPDCCCYCISMCIFSKRISIIKQCQYTPYIGGLYKGNHYYHCKFYSFFFPSSLMMMMMMKIKLFSLMKNFLFIFFFSFTHWESK